MLRSPNARRIVWLLAGWAGLMGGVCLMLDAVTPVSREISPTRRTVQCSVGFGITVLGWGLRRRALATRARPPAD